MNESLQYALAGIIVMAAVVVAVRAIVRAWRNKNTSLTACAGCKLRDVCTRPEKFSAKKCDDKVANSKNPS